jgi:hypothetical protein
MGRLSDYDQQALPRQSTFFWMLISRKSHTSCGGSAKALRSYFAGFLVTIHLNLFAGISGGMRQLIRRRLSNVRADWNSIFNRDLQVISIPPWNVSPVRLISFQGTLPRLRFLRWGSLAGKPRWVPVSRLVRRDSDPLRGRLLLLPESPATLEFHHFRSLDMTYTTGCYLRYPGNLVVSERPLFQLYRVYLNALF